MSVVDRRTGFNIFRGSLEQCRRILHNMQSQGSWSYLVVR